MIQRIKQLIKKNIQRQNKIIAQNEELIWAAVYHDSIRGKKEIEYLPLNIGRWAGNYPFFYLLNRVLSDYHPKQILEFGLGESSKFVSTYLDHYLLDSVHTIIEQDVNWATLFKEKFKLSSRSSIKIMPLLKKKYKEFEYNGYENIETTINSTFDLYIIDGPFGSENYSRFDVYALTEKLNLQDEFIIIMDDYDRGGEQETTSELVAMFKSKNIKIYSEVYKGVKTVKVLCTQKYKYLTSL